MSSFISNKMGDNCKVEIKKFYSFSSKNSKRFLFFLSENIQDSNRFIYATI